MLNAVQALTEMSDVASKDVGVGKRKRQSSARKLDLEKEAPQAKGRLNVNSKRRKV